MYSKLIALGLLAGGVAAQAAKGFNYGSTLTNNAPKLQQDFEAEFNQAKAIAGGPGFTSARIYTMIQGGSANTPISAIPAAIATQTRLLLGLWASAGEGGIQNEIAALTAAISQYGTAFTSLIDGISVGSEDLYRISPTGVINMSGVGAGPAEVANYINQVRNAIANTAASGALVGHVDTWTAWVNGSNQAVIDASDFIGMDAYPYFQNTIANSIELGQAVFNDALGATRGAVGGKPVWITETGWPVSGPQENQAVASIPNAETYWKAVGCQYFGNTNTWWYTLQDALPDTPSPSFGIVGAAGGTTPLFDLSCSGAASSSISGPSASAQASSVASQVSLAATGGSAAPTPDSGSPGPSALQGSSAAASAPSGSVSSAHLAPAGSSAANSAAGSSVPAASGGAPPAGTTIYETTSLCPVTMTGASGAVSTVLSTSTFTVTTCPGGCSKAATAAPVASSSVVASGAPAPPQSAAPQAPAPAPSASSAAGACPASLSGTYEYPHLIVPIDKNQPTKALGTSYNGTVSSTVSSIFNFDIPPVDAGKTCSLVFLLPNKQDLQTSNYELSGSGGLDIKGLSAPADEHTSYSNVPAVSGNAGSIPSVAPGNSYTISSGPCAAGQRIGYEVSATGSLGLNYFQDYNPHPVGLYITVC